MVAPAHHRVTWTGVFGSVASPVEIWSMGVSLGTDTSPFLTKAELVSMAGVLGTPWSTRVAPRVGSDVCLTNVRVAAIDNTGHTPKDVNGAYIQGDLALATGIYGSGASGRAPYSTSLAVSLQSAAAGAVGRGRFYLPGPALGTLSGGRLDQTTADQFRASMAGFLGDINTALTSYGVSVVIASGGSAARGIAGALYPVTKVGMGRVPDTQRRRRSNLSEDKAFTSL